MVKGPILIAGFGSAGRRHYRNLQALGATEFIFYRTGNSTLPDDEIAPWPVFTNLAEALTLAPRMAIIANPTALHLDVALSAAEAGCHLLIEKPVSHDLIGCAELLACVQRRRLTAMIGCQFRFHPLLSSLLTQLRTGRIGEPVAARAEYAEYLPGWHPWEDFRQSYSARADLGGGAILTLIHPLDYLYWLFGPVHNVHASTRAVPGLQTTTEDDMAEITLTFASGVLGQIHLDFLQRPPSHRLVVWGSEGWAELDFLADTLAWMLPDGHRAIEHVPAGFDRNSLFLDEMRHFLSAVTTSTPVCSPLTDGIEVLKLALLAKQDARERKHLDNVNPR